MEGLQSGFVGLQSEFEGLLTVRVRAGVPPGMGSGSGSVSVQVRVGGMLRGRERGISDANVSMCGGYMWTTCLGLG